MIIVIIIFGCIHVLLLLIGITCIHSKESLLRRIRILAVEIVCGPTRDYIAIGGHRRHNLMKIHMHLLLFAAIIISAWILPSIKA